MLPVRFELHRPASLHEALALKVQYGDDAAFYAGGTELLIALKARVLRYAHIIDIKRIPELLGIRASKEQVLTIGALCTHHSIANNPLVRELFPAYAELSEDVANIRVRAAGTIGGNVCFAEPHADPPALLCAAEARMHLADSIRERRVPMRDFIVGEFTTVREEDELLVAVEVPCMPNGSAAAYRSFGHTERPAVGVAAVHVPSAEQPWRLWAGALCSRPTQLRATEEFANSLPKGVSPDELIGKLGQVIKKEAEKLEVHDDLHGSAQYKRHLVTVLAKRAMEACLT